MSQFANDIFQPPQALPSLAGFDTRPPPEVRAATVDSRVAVNRLDTPDLVLEDRALERKSLAELAEFSRDDLVDYIRRSRPDDRTGVEVFLDMIDLPRNVIVGTAAQFLAPDAVAKARSRKEFATFGLPRVFTSDVLEALGVENRLARAVIGFVGDVAFDPLTYVGAGTGRMIVKGSGVVPNIAIAREGSRALRQGIKTVARGGRVADPTVQRVLDVAAGRVQGFDAMEAAARQSALSEQVFGRVVRDGGRERVLRVAGFDQRAPGGIIGEFFGRTSAALDDAGREAVDAVGQFVKAYGPNSRGIRIRGGGSTFAHIPFTSIGIHAPGFTNTGRQAALQHAVAVASTTPDTVTAVGAFADVIRSSEDIQTAVDEAQRIYSGLANAMENLSGENARNAGTLVTPRTREQMRSANAAIDELRLRFEEQVFRVEQAHESMRATRAAQARAGVLTGEENAATLEAVMHLHEQQKAADAQLKRLQAMRDGFPSRQALSERLQLRTARSQFIAGRVADLLDDAAPAAAKEQAAREAADYYARTLSDVQNAVIDMHDETAELAEQLADSIHKSVEAAQELADITRGSISRYMNAEERVIVDAAKNILNLGDDVMGSSPLKSFRTVVRSVLPKHESAGSMAMSLDRGLRSVFGRRGGSMNDFASSMMRRVQQGSVDAGDASARFLARQLSAIKNAHGLKRADDDQLLAILAAKVHQAAGGDQAYYATRLDGSPSAMMELIENATRNGLLQNPDLARDLDRLAGEMAEVYGSLGDLALEDALLVKLLPGYVPIGMSREAAERLRVSRSSGARTVQDRVQNVFREGFRRKRSTNQYRFARTLEDGSQVTEQVFEFERTAYGAMSNEFVDQIRQVDPQMAADIEQIRERVRAFDAWRAERYPNLTDDQVAQLLSRPTDAFELNEQYQAGRFGMLLGGDLETAPFETNPIALMASRMAAQVRGTAKESFRRDVGKFAIPVGRMHAQDDGRRVGFETLAFGESITLPDGREATVIRMGNAPGGRGVRVGEQVYRKINPAFQERAEIRVFDDTMDAEMLEALFPEEVAERIERFAELFEPNNANAFARSVEAMTAAWKGQTLLHPSWIMLNLIGNTMLAAMDGIRPDQMLRHSREAMRVAMAANDPERAMGRTIRIRGVEADVADIARDAIDTGAIQSTRSGGHLYEMLDRGVLDLAPGSFNQAMAGGVRGYFAGLRDDWLDAARKSANAAGRKHASKMDKVKVALPVAVQSGVVRRIMAPWFRANQFLENWQRSMVYLSHIENGADAAEAGRRTARAMFDYTDFTGFEERLRRIFIPFYSWMRLNGVYQFERLFDNPRYAALMPKTQQALEEAFAGEAALPPSERPRWMRAQMAVQIGEDPSRRAMLSTLSMLPQEQIIRYGAGAFGGREGKADLFREMVGSVNPVVKGVFELAAGREIYTGRTISWAPQSGDLTPEEYGLGQIRLFRELGIGNRREGALVNAFEQGIGVQRLIAGGRFQLADDERLRGQRIRDFDNEERDLRRAISLVRREQGDEAAEPQVKALLALYQRMIEAGLGDEVPRWAQNKLAGVDQ